MQMPKLARYKSPNFTNNKSHKIRTNSI